MLDTLQLSSKKIQSMLKQAYDGYNYMIKSHPKSARKKRNRKKWRKRYGEGFSEMVYHESSFISSLTKDENHRGAYIRIPLDYVLDVENIGTING